MPTPLIDIAVNLTAPAFHSDLDAVLARAAAAGVVAMIAPGSTVADSARALALARAHEGVVFSAAGVHPHHAATCDADTIPALRRLAAERQVVAIGECGLDFFRDLSPRPVQERWFAEQLDLAAQLGLPVYLHERDAHARFAAIVREQRRRLARAVVHCFTGDETALRTYLDLDLHIGITGWICDERRGRHLQELVRLIPRGRLMIETDAPWLIPRTILPRPRSGRNEPAFLPFVLDVVARCRGESVEEVAAHTTATARAFFALPDGPRA
ncbi:MAG TPA: TatD family hydrolase [Planctomycetota bacterium]|nr:TatD family hydrolase [Planctomycetota bacterium]